MVARIDGNFVFRGNLVRQPSAKPIRCVLRIHWGEMRADIDRDRSNELLGGRGTRSSTAAVGNDVARRPVSKVIRPKAARDLLTALKGQYGGRPNIARLADDTPFNVLLLHHSEVHGWAACIHSLGDGPAPIRTLGDFRNMSDAALRSRPRIGARMFSELSKLRYKVGSTTTKKGVDGRGGHARNIERALEQRRAFLEKTYGKLPQIVYLKDDTPIDVLLLHKSGVHGWSAGIHALGRGEAALKTLGDLRHISDAVLRTRPRVGPRVFAELRVVCPFQSVSELKTPQASDAGRTKIEQRRVNPAI